MNRKLIWFLLLVLFLISGCSKNENNDVSKEIQSGVDFSFLKDENIKILSWNFFIDEQGNIYDIVKDKNNLFSNEKKYKLRDSEPKKAKEILWRENSYIIIPEDSDDVYCNNIGNFYGCKDTFKDTSMYKSYKNGKSNKFFTMFNNLDNEHEQVFYISNNGKIMVDNYKYNYNINIFDPSYGTYTVSTEEYLSINSSKILYVITSVDEVPDKEIIKYILTDDGLYEYTIEEKKYEDQESKYYYKKNEKYDNIKNNIIYNDLSIVLTDDYKAMNFLELIHLIQ